MHVSLDTMWQQRIYQVAIEQKSGTLPQKVELLKMPAFERAGPAEKLTKSRHRRDWEAQQAREKKHTEKYAKENLEKLVDMAWRYFMFSTKYILNFSIFNSDHKSVENTPAPIWRDMMQRFISGNEQ
jgi:hypothetical protein